MKRNPHLALLNTNYLFPEINLRKQRFLLENPHASLISLGIGDTTQPIPSSINEALVNASTALGTQEGYSGYGPERGIKKLREDISARIYQGSVHADDIFISDGAKCDIGRLQSLFGNNVSIAIQDPAYPVYVDGSIIQGVKEIVYLKCTPENDFFPDLNSVPRTDLIYFCSPNNPTGAVATRAQLEQLVDFAIDNKSIIIFDAAYANYIQDPSLPKSIFEIRDAKKVAIELGSFSKLAGFTGVRLGWTVIPEDLKYDDGFPVKADWNRLTSTLFNGASNISQQGGSAVLNDKGWQEVISLTRFYLENAAIIKDSLQKIPCEVFGGINAPYLWVRFKNQSSWELFNELLNKYHIITTPGSGFGRTGDSFLRFSSFGQRKNILEAASRLKKETL